jgi:hypothetical protein
MPDFSVVRDTRAKVSEPILKLRPDALEWRPIEGEVVAVDLRSSVYFAVNRTGAIIWPELASGTTREHLVRRLAQACELEPGQARSEVDEFVAALTELDLLEA